jgi:sterol 14-demethylase
LYQEQKRNFGNSDGTFRDLTYEDLKDLPLLDACIRETLRMVGHSCDTSDTEYTWDLQSFALLPFSTHPSSESVACLTVGDYSTRSMNWLGIDRSSIMRKVMSDMPVPTGVAAPSKPDASYIVPKGHFVLASPGVAQMDPMVWQDASIWNPHRWVDEKGVASKALAEYTSGDKVDYGYGSVSKGTESPYQPFGAGRHRCIGESVSHFQARIWWSNSTDLNAFLCQFAYVQLQSILATFIRNMEMKLDGPFPKTNYQVNIDRASRAERFADDPMFLDNGRPSLASPGFLQSTKVIGVAGM